ncbi:hypothetical protein D9M69_503400 [compost metagenome]
MKLERIANQVLKKLPHMRTVGLNTWQITNRNCSSGPFNLSLKITKYVVSDLLEVNYIVRRLLRTDARESEQIFDQDTHA